MRSQQQRFRSRRSERNALLGLRFILAVVLATLGFGSMFAPGAVEDLGHVRLGPGLVSPLLVASHLAAGIALLVPRLAERAALLLGLSIAGVAVSLLGAGEAIPTGGLAFMAFALLLLGAGLWLRRRTDAAAWHEMLARYADPEDWGRFRKA